jgi:hypothetical protein
MTDIERRTLSPLTLAFVAVGILFGLGLPGPVQAQITFSETLTSPNGGEGFGMAVGEIGDVDGDDVPDVVVGAPKESGNGLFQAGRAYIFSGTDGGRITTLTSPNAEESGRFGAAVAGIEDLNADGIPDVIVGAPQETFGGAAEAGRAYVLSGADGSLIHPLTSPDPKEAGAFGADLIRVSDLDGDGMQDVVVGAPGESLADNREGILYFFGGGDGAKFQETPTPLNDGFGTNVTDLGDVTGDGLSEVLASERSNAIFVDGATGDVLDSAAFSTGISELARLADVDRDGSQDVLVGASGEDDLNSTEGTTYVYSGADREQISQIRSPNASDDDFFGSAGTGVGDLNGDGIPEIVVGAKGETVGGTQGAGRMYLLASSDGTVYQTIDPPSQSTIGGQFGASIAEIGDVDGNGTPDVVVGEPAQSRVHLFTTSSFERIAPPSNVTVSITPPTVTLRWDAVSGGAADQYNIYRDTKPIDGRPSDVTPTATVEGSSTTFADAPGRGDTYFYRITAVDANGTESVFTKELRVYVPPTPLGESLLTLVSPTVQSGGERGTFGAEVTAFPDVNGDGVQEVVVGSPFEANSSGRAYMFSGADGLLLREFQSPNPGDVNFGDEISVSGDVTNGGVADLLIRSNARIVHFSGEDGQMIRTYEVQNQSPESVGSVSDVNGDGVPDVLWGASPSYLLSGADGSVLETFNDPSSTDFGAAIAGLDDVNGDGTPDVAIGAPDLERVYVFSGADGSALEVFQPSSATATFGDVVAAVRDLTGDGRTDVVVGAPGAERNGEIVGEAFSFDAGSGSLLERLLSANTFAGSEFGQTVAGLRDVDTDGDRLSNVLVGAPFEGANEPEGDANGEVYLFSVFGDVLQIFESPNPDERGSYGSGIAEIQDLTGDGVNDLIVGAFTESVQGTPAGGRVYVQPVTTIAAEEEVARISTDGSTAFSAVGVQLDLSGVQGAGDVTVARYNSRPSDTEGISEQNVSSYRFTLEASGDLQFSTADVRFDVNTLSGVGNADNVTVYRRTPTENGGSFTSLSTSFDAGSNELVASTSGFGEFVLASNTEPLPVDLARFDAAVDGEDVRLSWATASETNNASFRIQRKAVGEGADEASWTTVGSVEGAATTSEMKTYQYTDDGAPYEADRLTYRLEQVDLDGSTSYSTTVTVQRGVEEVRLRNIFPNPADEHITVRYALPARGDVEIRVYDVLGRQVRVTTKNQQGGRHSESLNVSNLPSGTYFLQLQAGSEIETRRLTVLQ